MKKQIRKITVGMLSGALVISMALPVPAQAAAKVRLSKTKLTITKGSKKKLKVKGTKAKVKWKSSNKKIASVSGKGVVKAKKTGKATITATVKGKGKTKRFTCKVTVVAKKASTSTSGNKASSSSTSAIGADSGGTAGTKTDTASVTEESAYQKIMAFQSNYPEGTAWTNKNSYNWNGGIWTGGAGCMGFIFMLSDGAFGNLPARKLSISQSALQDLRVGDIVRYLDDSHAVMVLQKKSSSIIVTEGNYNGTVHWGREIAFDEILKSGTFILTRYPKA